MAKRKLPDLLACCVCNRVPLGDDGCGCPNDLQVTYDKRNQPTHYGARRYGPVHVQEAREVVVSKYEGPVILPLAERA